MWLDKEYPPETMAESNIAFIVIYYDLLLYVIYILCYILCVLGLHDLEANPMAPPFIFQNMTHISKFQHCLE